MSVIPLIPGSGVSTAFKKFSSLSPFRSEEKKIRIIDVVDVVVVVVVNVIVVVLVLVLVVFVVVVIKKRKF